jgi:hypothetical protein
MLTIPHDIMAARKQCGQFLFAADKYPHHSNKWHAEYCLLQLISYANNGIWDCYLSVESMLCDWYMDLTWGKVRMDAQIKIIMADPRFDQVKKGFLENHNFDIVEELENALNYDPEDC